MEKITPYTLTRMLSFDLATRKIHNPKVAVRRIYEGVVFGDLSALKLDQTALDLPIMLVDDIPQVLAALERTLCRKGFTNIISFDNPQEAIEYFKTAEDTPRLIVTDLSMPEISGNQLITEIAKSSSDKPPRFIIHSGDQSPSLEQTDPVRQVMNEYKAYFIQKGLNIEDVVIDVAVEIVCCFEPDVSLTLAAHREKTAFDKNPYYKFMGRLIHLINNVRSPLTSLLTVFAMEMEEENPEAPISQEDTAELKKCLEDFFQDIQLLSRFAKLDNLKNVNNLEETDLPQKLINEVEEIWVKLNPKDKPNITNLSLITQLYLDNIFLKYVQVINKIWKEVLFSNNQESRDPTTITGAQITKAAELFTTASDELNNRHLAAQLSKGVDPQLVTIFSSYFAMLADSQNTA